ncbi:MAG TPA: glycosyltransferase family 39 protein [Anaerolineales bacterium]
MADESYRGTPRRIWQSLLIGALLTLGVLIVMAPLNPLTSLMGRNGGSYAYIATHLLRGETPYISAWDHKPPMIYFINALGLIIGGGTRWGIWAVEFASMLAAVAFGFAALRRSLGLVPAFASSALWLWAIPPPLREGNFTEEFALLFSFASLWLFILILERPTSFWLHAAVGLAFGMNFLLRPNNAGVQVAVVLAELLVVFPRAGWRTAIRTALGLAAGALLPLAAVTLFFALRGAVPEFIEASFTYNLIYSTQPDMLAGFIAGIRVLGMPAWIALLGVAIAFWRLVGSMRGRQIDPMAVWLCIDFGIEVAFTGLSGRELFHYYISWMPFTAVAAALLMHELVPAWRGQEVRHALPGMAVLLLALIIGFRSVLAKFADTARQLARDRGHVQRVDVLSEYANVHTEPNETVLAWASGGVVNFLSHRDSPTPFFLYWNLVPCAITDRISAQFIEDIRTRPPKLILDLSQYGVAPLSTADPLAWYAANGFYAQPQIDEFYAFVQANYEYVTDLGDVEVYELRR